ncbi:phosphonate metabolism transcriptional regulator PhnF [Veronia pacifica]|uniref:Phosphonate metabolism transcriptional regulator PhnF n=1 Tax=Veronia pacifica TaxID=1080227 RepID=A0A1C3EIE8_9GAMM|nr:phosphonate metabolism transcriptional regulator PhnF [Veronia pacifica]ODA33026.1 phosphonate metabolism transcriptional regulator PhnF [Veronia pacifica]
MTRVYLDIARELEEEVRGQYKAGDYLPSESKLASRFSVNRHTVRRAVDELVFSGIIERQQGRGNMVVSQPYDYPLHAGARFTDNLVEQGSMPSSVVVSRALVEPSENIARLFALASGKKVIKLRTLRKVDGMPCSVIDHYLADSSWWPVVKYFEYGSLHHFLKENVGVHLSRHSTRVRAALPSKTDCRLLQLSSKTPLLIFKTTNVREGTSEIVEFSSSHTRSDFVEIVLEH